LTRQLNFEDELNDKQQGLDKLKGQLISTTKFRIVGEPEVKTFNSTKLRLLKKLKYRRKTLDALKERTAIIQLKRNEIDETDDDVKERDS